MRTQAGRSALDKTDDHIRDAVAALDVTLTSDEIVRLEAPYLAHSILGH